MAGILVSTTSSIVGATNALRAGAKGDGSTNDATAINAAITALGSTGGRIILPPGHYRLRKTGTYSADSLTVPYALRIDQTIGPVELVGVPGATFLELDTWATSADDNVVPLLIGGSSGARRTAPTTIYGITVDGRVAAQRTAGATYSDFGVLTTVSSDGVVVDNCDIRGWNAYGLHFLRSSSGVRLRDSRLIESVKCGLASSLGALLRIECYDVDVDGCLFLTDPFHGHGSIQFGDNADIALQARGMRVRGSGFFGGGVQVVSLGGVDGGILEGNYFSDNLKSAIYTVELAHYTNANGTVYSSRHCVVANNHFHNCQNGLRTTGSNGTINSTKWSEGAYLNTIANNTFTTDMDAERTSVGTLANAFPVPQLPYGNIVFETGTATSGGASTLTNSGAAWTSNEWIDSVIVTTGGTGSGQTRRIASNTATAITASVAWTVQPDATTTYRIQSYYSGTATAGASGTLTDSGADWGTNSVQNGLITITGGTGAGQVRKITSHTGTVVTITGTWGTNPDSTSTYALTIYNTRAMQTACQDGAASSTSGTTTSATSSTLTCTSTSFTTDQFKNWWVFITGGTGQGQMRRITTNTNAANSVLTVDTNFTVTPDTTSTWTIATAPVGLNTWIGNVVQGGSSTKAYQTANFNNGSIFDNNMAHGMSSANVVTDTGASTPKALVKSIHGYNPLSGGITQPAVPSSTVAAINSYGVDATVYVAGGTVTVIAVNGTTTGLITGAIRVPFGQTIAITYSVAPTWVWYGD